MTGAAPQNELAQVISMVQSDTPLEGNPEYEELMAGLMEKKKRIDKAHSAVVKERQDLESKRKACRKRKKKLSNKSKRQNRRK